MTDWIALVGEGDLARLRELPFAGLERIPPPKREGLPVGHEWRVLRRFLTGGSAPVVFSLGSSAAQASGDFYEQAAAAVEPLGRRAVLVLGASPPPPDLPADVLAIRSTPLDRLFRSASLVVHAGAGLTRLTLLGSPTATRLGEMVRLPVSGGTRPLYGDGLSCGAGVGM